MASSREGGIQVRSDVSDGTRCVRAQKNHLKTAIFHQEILSVRCEGKPTTILHLHEAWYKEHREAIPFMEEKIMALGECLGSCFGKHGFSELAIRAAFHHADGELVSLMKNVSASDDPFPTKWEDDEPDIDGKRPIQVFKDKYWLWLTHYTTTVVAIQCNRLLVAGGGSFAVILADGKQAKILNPPNAEKARAGMIFMDTLEPKQLVILALQSQANFVDAARRIVANNGQHSSEIAREILAADPEDRSAVAIVLEQYRSRSPSGDGKRSQLPSGDSTRRSYKRRGSPSGDHLPSGDSTRRSYKRHGSPSGDSRRGH